jgi:hypothetical protein
MHQLELEQYSSSCSMHQLEMHENGEIFILLFDAPARNENGGIFIQLFDGPAGNETGAIFIRPVVRRNSWK